jgi:hypothetical protein
MTSLDSVVRTPLSYSFRAIAGLVSSSPGGASMTATLHSLLGAVSARVYEYVAYTAEYLVDGSVTKAGRAEQPESMPP